jgi:DNA-binding NarL/FixJ family response regulator
MKENPIHIVVADNQFLITEALQHILQKEGKFLVKIISNKYELLKVLELEKTSLLIVDYAQIDFEKISELSEIKTDFPKVHMLVLTNAISKNELHELNSYGINNIILKTADEEELFEAINASLKEKKYYSPELLDMLFEIAEKKGNSNEIVQLTNTEIEIVRLIAEGLTTKDIASRKNISFHTVMSHRKNIFRKLGVSSVSELIM